MLVPPKGIPETQPRGACDCIFKVTQMNSISHLHPIDLGNANRPCSGASFEAEPQATGQGLPLIVLLCQQAAASGWSL